VAYRGPVNQLPRSQIEVRAVTGQDWPEVQAVFATPGDPGRCWCQWFRLRGKDFEATPVAARRAALQAECVSGEPGPGVLARVDDVAAGWAAVAPRARYPRLAASPLLRRLPDDDQPADAVWAVSCFVVRPQFRARGISRALLDGAVEHAQSVGARVLEGYPVDLAVAAGVTAARLYHGATSTFVAAGFTEIARPRPDRPIMRLRLG
jgi:GNAT superfamily N-acetyltransferase